MVILILIIQTISKSTSEDLRTIYKQINAYYQSQDRSLPEDLKYLTTFEVNPRMREHIGEGIHIHFNESISKIINKSVQKTQEESDVFGPGYPLRILETKIDFKSSQRYLVDYVPGASADPMFTIYSCSSSDTLEAGMIAATDLIIPGDGYIYASGHTNSMFDKHRKYTIEKQHIIEVEQPFYYVGLDTVTIDDIVIYSDFNNVYEVAQIPAGIHITVVINKDDKYLLKTSTGIVGWITIPMGYNSPLKYIFYRGD